MQSYLLAYTRIALDRNYEIFGQIANIRGVKARVVCDPKPIPATVKFKWYSDEGLQERNYDAYGDPLKFVYAHELSKVNLDSDAGAWNKAAFAFVRALPPDTIIVLWWH